MHRLVPSSVALFLLLGFGAEPHTAGRTAVFQGARLIVGDGRAPIENASFVVTNGRIASVGPASAERIPRSADRVDLTGKTVMPALIEAHSHPGYRKGLTFSADNYTHDNLLDTLRRFAYYGVGAVLALGTDRGELPFQLRAEPHPGAALFRTAGAGFAMPNSGPGGPMRDAAYGVTTDAEAIRDVRALAARHVDIVKIWVDDRGGTVPKLTPPLYRAIIREAHVHQLRVVAHVFDLADAKDLMRAGVDGFAHLPRDRVVDDEFLGLVKQRANVFFLTTLWGERRGVFAGRPAWLDDPLLRETMSAEERQQLSDSFTLATADERERSHRIVAIVNQNIVKLASVGARFGLGTDSGGVSGGQFFGLASHVEMESMVAAGLTPVQVLVAATRNSAQIVGLDRRGALLPGNTADFIVLNANPLDDIRNTRRIASVYLEGEPVDRMALKAGWAGATQ